MADVLCQHGLTVVETMCGCSFQESPALFQGSVQLSVILLSHSLFHLGIFHHKRILPFVLGKEIIRNPEHQRMCTNSLASMLEAANDCCCTTAF